MRALEDVRIFWQTLTSFHNINDLKQALRDDEQATLTNIRSICWKIFLLFQNADQSSWLQTLVDSRSAYDSLRAHFLRAIDNPDEVDSDIDPLSEHEESPWAALRNDEAIRNEIFQDVERCMPEITYFRQPTTQKMLLDILFIYCKLNPDVSYRQGMHELLAPILWVVERDAIDEAVAYAEADEPLSMMVSSQHIEHDTFTLFTHIMQTAKSFYEPAGSWQARSKSTIPDRKDNQQESPLLQRCNLIFNDLLLKTDPELADHLHSMEIVPQIFLMRWLRLLFGREFQFDELLQVWDLIFVEDPSLELVDYMSTAMLLRIRWQLLAANANEALTLLFRYPSPPPMHPPSSFVDDAILLRANCSVETGHQLILKYSGRAPRRMSAAAEMRSTPQHIRKESASRSPSLRSPFGSPASSTLESVFQDVARSMLNRGERWGFGQAMRDALGEVRKNMQTLQSGRSSPLPRSLPGITVTQAHRSKRSDASSTIAANVLRRINALEERNKQLAKVLEAAVSDLWRYQKSLAEREKADCAESLEAMNVAVAKVQFVQVYLSDSSLLLPEDQGQSIDRQLAESGASTPGESGAEKSSASREEQEQEQDLEQHGQIATAAPTVTVGTTNQNISDDSAQSDSIDNPQNAISATTDRLQVTSSLSKSIPTSKTSPSTAHRPTLVQSSFSYMLDQAHSDPSSSFLHATPLSPNERRNRGSADKAFLFGDEEDVGSDDSRSKGGFRARGKGKSKGATLMEDIGLGELGNGGSNAD